MSFGWSAGDIAASIHLLIKIARALNDAQGSVEDFRRTSCYLTSTEIVLKQLCTIIKTQEDGIITLTPEELSDLESVIKPLHTLMNQLAAKVEKFAEFEGTGTSLQWRTMREFSKVKWEFMVRGEVKVIVDDMDRQIALWARLWNSISFRISISTLQRGEATSAIYQQDILSMLRSILQYVTSADSKYPPGLLSIGPHDGVPQTTPSSNETSLVNFDVESALSHCGKYKQPNMTDQVAARVANMKVDRILVGTIDKWLKGASAPRLWLYGRAASTVSATIFSTAFKRNRHIVAYSCRHIKDGIPMDLEKRMIGLTYSFLFQMLQQVSEQASILLPAAAVDVNNLDGTIGSVGIAIDLIKHILDTIHDFVFIIDGFQYLAIDPSNTPSVQVQEHICSILGIFEMDIGREDIEMGPRVLLTSAGNVPFIYKKDTKYLTRLFVDDHKDKGQFTLAYEMLGVQW